MCENIYLTTLQKMFLQVSLGTLKVQNLSIPDKIKVSYSELLNPQFNNKQVVSLKSQALKKLSENVSNNYLVTDFLTRAVPWGR